MRPFEDAAEMTTHSDSIDDAREFKTKAAAAKYAKARHIDRFRVTRHPSYANRPAGAGGWVILDQGRDGFII